MKKIFAIALALVMVLSMASAFATYCNWGAWDCATTSINCGKATVEVVPYVRSSTACAGESTFVQSDCAAAVPKENVYFAIKLTVDADVNEDWYKAAKLTVKSSNVTQASTINHEVELPDWKDANGAAVASNGGVFWLAVPTATDASLFPQTAAWEEEDASFTFGDKNVFKAVAEKTSAKVCATLKSVWAIGDAKDHNKTWGDDTGDTGLVIGKYWFGFMDGSDYTDAPAAGVDKWILAEYDANASKQVVIALDGDKVVGAYATLNGGTSKAYFSAVNAAGEYTGVVETGPLGTIAEGKVLAQAPTCDNEAALVKEIFDFLKIGFGTCMTDQGISNNFGWNDEIKSCTAYKTQGTAVVDAECVVAIPKTGDASVLAWLF